MLNRRTFLRTAPAAGAVLAVPALAIAEAKPVMTPDERIDAALAEIVIALRERYPNCPIRVDDIENIDTGVIMIVTHCADDKPGTINRRRRKASLKPHVYFDDGGPLLAEDAGCYAYRKTA